MSPDLIHADHFVSSGTRLEGAESFDAKFFGLTRREAEIMDPQQGIFLECTYEAMEHAGLTGDGARVGLFAGSGMNTYLMQLLGNPEVIASAGEYQLLLGNDNEGIPAPDLLVVRGRYSLSIIPVTCTSSSGTPGVSAFL